MFHQKRNHIATFSATEIFPNLFHGAHHKTWRTLIGKRAEAFVVASGFFQLYKIANHLLYSGSFENVVYGGPGNQDICICLLNTADGKNSNIMGG